MFYTILIILNPGRNPREPRIVCREYFVSISRKTFSQNAFARVGGILTKSKNFFRTILHFYNMFTKTGVYDE